VTIFLSLLLSLSCGGLALYLSRALENQSLRLKWLKSGRIKKTENYFSKRKKLKSIRRDLPFVIDLLSISVQAGLDIIQALQRIVIHMPEQSLRFELEKILEDLKLGKTRKEAFLGFKERVKLLEVAQFVSLLVQAFELGSPLAPVLTANAEQMRDNRFSQAERLGQQAALKILFPLIFLIMPSIILLIFGPLAIRFLTEGFGGMV